MEFVITFLDCSLFPSFPPVCCRFCRCMSRILREVADKKHKVFLRALCFVLGFTAVFSLLGLFAGTLGAFLMEYRTVVNIVGGCC